MLTSVDKSNALAVAIIWAGSFATAGLLYAILGGDAAPEPQRVGDTSFCIPDENRRSTQFWDSWIPDADNLAETSGVHFVLGGPFYRQHPQFEPLLDLYQRPRRMNGLIEATDVYRGWEHRSPGDSVYEDAADPATPTRPLDRDDLVAVFTSPDMTGWSVWSVAEPHLRKAGPIAEAGRLIAHCNRSAPALEGTTPTTSCQRIFYIGDLAVSYGLHPDDLVEFESFDAVMASTVSSWMCD